MTAEDRAPKERAPRREFGFRGFWPVVEAEFPKFFEVSPKTLTALHSVTDREYPKPEPHQRAILNLSMLAGISVSAIVTLTVNGMGHGAMRELRSLLETSINTEYLRLRPAEFEDYKEWYWVERFKEQEYLRAHADLIYKQIDAKTVNEVDQNMARVLPRFERKRHDGTKEIRRSWCSLNLADRSVVTGNIETYRLINPLASSFVHETMYGLARHFDATKDIDRVDIPPSLDYSAEALSGAHHCIVRVVSTVSQTFNVPSEPTVAELEKDWHYAWR
jgi:hypothetical protein